MIDSSIYFQQQPADIMGSVERGMKMGDMLNQRKKETALQDAYKAGVVRNPDGTVTRDGSKTMSAMIDAGLNNEAYDFQEKERANKSAQEKAQYEKVTKATQFFGSALDNIKDQNSYDQHLQMAKQMGADVSGMPPQWGTDAQNKLKYYSGMAFSAKDKLDQSNKDREFSLKERELALKAREEKTKQQKGGKVGQDALDRDFAKDYNDWTSGGAKSARSEINKLSGVVKDLKEKKVTTGGLTGMFPDQMTSDKVLSARADVQSTVMNSLRAILGAQFTEKEGERIIKNTWNEADSTENNVARLERLVADLQNQAADKDEKSRYYEQGGTLTGYKGMGQPPSGKAQNIAQVKPKVFKTNEIEWAD